MSSCERRRRGWTALALLWAAAACSPRTLRVVDSDGATQNGDGNSDTTIGGRDADAAPDSNPATTLRQGLVGLWHFDDGPGSSTALDSSGNGNNGTLEGVGFDPATAWVADHAGGAAGSALATNGIGYVLVPLSASIASIDAGVTVSAWVYLDGPISDYGTAISRQIGNTVEQYYHLGLRMGALPSLFVTTVGGAAAAHPMFSIPTPTTTWTHLAGTYDGASVTLYVGGELVDSVPYSGAIVSDTTPLILGANGNGPGTGISERFPGRIDEIALYNRALTPSEIRLLANSATF